MGITPETIPKDMTALERLCVSEVRVDKHYGALTSGERVEEAPECGICSFAVVLCTSSHYLQPERI